MGLKETYEKSLSQTALLWRKTAEVDNTGQPVYEYAGEIQCRWEDKQKLVTDLSGEEVLSSATVYVNTDIAVDDYVILNEIVNGVIPSESSLSAREAFKVLRNDRIKGLDNIATIRILYLSNTNV